MQRYGYDDFTVLINGKDVTEGVTICEIYMDITNPVWSATVAFMDSVDLINTLPIRKNDKVKIIIKTGNIFAKDRREFDFVLYKIDDKIHYNQNSIGFRLYTVSKPFTDNMTKRVSRHLQGEPIGIAQSLFSEYFGGYTCESSASNGQVNMIASAWTPFNTFGQLLKAAHKDNVADYLIFQCDNTKFKIKSIAEMYNENSGIKFKYIPNGITGNNYPYLITKYEIEQFDGTLNLSSGFYGSNVYSYDLSSKKFTNKKYSNDKDKASLSDGESYNNDADGHVVFQPMHQGITGDDSQLNNFNTWLPSRHSALMKLEQEKLLIQTNGNMEYIGLLGKSCLVEMPKQDYKSRQQLDTKRSGKYLVTAMGFIINKQMFITNLEMVKREFE